MIGIFLIVCYFIYATHNSTPTVAPVQPQPISVYVVSDMRPIPHSAVDLIKKYEGFVPNAYQDQNGEWLIGYGHKVHGCYKKTVTLEEAERMIREDLQDIAPLVLKEVDFPLTNNQYSALLSFAYNVGINNFARSSLLKAVKERQAADIVAEFLRWDTDQNGTKHPGLVARRKEEAALYLAF